MPTDNPRPGATQSLSSQLQKHPLALGLLGVLVIALLATLAWRVIFSPAKTPPALALETAAAETLKNRYGNLYTLAHLIPGPALDRPPPPPPAADAQPGSASPVSPVAPVAPAADGRVYYNATLTARLAGALYLPVDTADYIANELKLDTAAERKIAQIINGPGGARIRELAGIDPKADSLASTRLVRETARAGARIEFTARIDALRTDSGWQVNILSLTPAGPLPQGDTLDKFSGRLLDITRDSDVAALRRLAGHADETLRRVEAARDRHRAELAATAGRATAAALASLTPGTLHAGPATLPGQRATPGLCLEIVSLDRAASTLRATLRADGSWINARPLAGTFAYDTGSGLFTLALSAREGAPLHGAGGLVVAGEGAFNITLRLDAAGLSGDAGEWSCKLARVPDSARAATINAFGAAENALFEATRPGLVYRVRTADEDALLLRFRTQNRATGALTATIENTRDNWTRELQGSLAAGAARADGYPLRLLSTLDSAQAPVAPSIGLSLRPEAGDRLRGSIRMRDTHPVTLEIATDAHLAELDARARALAGQKNAAAARDAIDTTALLENMPAPTRPAAPVPAREQPPPAPLPEGGGASVWDADENAWKPLPTNKARVVRSTLQKVGGVFGSAVSLIKTRPEKQETGTLTFEGPDAPPAVAGRDVLLVFRGEFHTYEGTPAGIQPIEVTRLEIKNKGRKRVAELERLGEAAATFGNKSERTIIEQPENAPGAWLIRLQRTLPAGRYALHAPGHSFEFEVRK